jgi:hypothetical protein
MMYEDGESRWNYIDRGKLNNSGRKPVPVPACPPQIPHGLVDLSKHILWDRYFNEDDCLLACSTMQFYRN